MSVRTIFRWTRRTRAFAAATAGVGAAAASATDPGDIRHAFFGISGKTFVLVHGALARRLVLAARRRPARAPRATRSSRRR